MDKTKLLGGEEGGWGYGRRGRERDGEDGGVEKREGGVEKREGGVERREVWRRGREGGMERMERGRGGEEGETCRHDSVLFSNLHPINLTHILISYLQAETPTLTMLAHCVPFPAPGPPSTNTTSGLAADIALLTSCAATFFKGPHKKVIGHACMNM